MLMLFTQEEEGYDIPEEIEAVLGKLMKFCDRQ